MKYSEDFVGVLNQNVPALMWAQIRKYKGLKCDGYIDYDDLAQTTKLDMLGIYDRYKDKNKKEWCKIAGTVVQRVVQFYISKSNRRTKLFNSKFRVLAKNDNYGEKDRRFIKSLELPKKDEEILIEMVDRNLTRGQFVYGGSQFTTKEINTAIEMAKCRMN